MGTMASLTIADTAGAERARAAVAACTASLAADEQRFSHYRAASDITLWLAGEQVRHEAQVEIEEVLADCLLLEAESDGVFAITDPSTGRVDTAGYVKGYAIRKAVQAVHRVGVVDFTLNVGGDSFSSGRPDPDRPWRVAIVDPMRPRAISAIVDASDLAVATSGTAQRGEHIWLGSGPARSSVASFTVTGPDIALADAYATIGFAMGWAGIDWVASHRGYSSLVIDRDGALRGDAALVSVR